MCQLNNQKNNLKVPSFYKNVFLFSSLKSLSMKKQYLKYISLVLLTLSIASCVRDLDFDQAENIVLEPAIELDLLYFNFEGSAFFNDIFEDEIITVRDTISVDFLSGSDTKNVLRRVELYFEFENSIPRNFDIAFEFYSRNNELVYVMNTLVVAGSISNPRKTLLIQNIESQNLEQLTKAVNLVAVVTILSSEQELIGTLSLKSKASYFLEIKL